MSTPGRSVAGWVLEERLGSGGFGEVWKARRRHAGLIRALKLVRIASPEAFDSWRHEIGRLETLSHPNVVRFYDADVVTDGPYRGHAWIATELCVRSLADELARRPGHRLTEPESERLLGEMLAALAAAHDGGCVHRDLKPANILLHHSGAWKLCDFGTARLVPDGASHPETRVVGTSPYMSPAAHRGHQDRAADLYALGVTVHEVLCGRRLHPRPEGLSDSEYVKAILDTPPTIASDLPRRWRTVVEALIGGHGDHPAGQLAAWFDATRGTCPPGDARPGGNGGRRPPAAAAAAVAAGAAAAAAGAASAAPEAGAATSATAAYPATQATVVKQATPSRDRRTVVVPAPAAPASGPSAASAAPAARAPSAPAAPNGRDASPPSPAPASPAPARPATPSPSPASPPTARWPGGQPPVPAGYAPYGYSPYAGAPGAYGPYGYGPSGPAGPAGRWPVRPTRAVRGRRVIACLLDGTLTVLLTWLLLAAFPPEYARLETGGLDDARDTCEELVDGGAASCITIWTDVLVAGDTPWRTWLTPVAVSLAGGVVVQGLIGWTPGKLLVGLRTVRSDGRPPGLGRGLIRWLMLPIDALPLCFPLIGTLMVLSSRGHRRLGDSAAGTLVARRREVARPRSG